MDTDLMKVYHDKMELREENNQKKERKDRLGR